jgi:hypothetical protein
MEPNVDEVTRLAHSLSISNSKVDLDNIISIEDLVIEKKIGEGSGGQVFRYKKVLIV